ncbi:MAG: DEAD/DEAH box helicase, partial [Gammaproteobacteria bacterium]|nr:DEAD/DEAH box helicase [Gammaproteobacteria bacterium]
MDRHPTPIKFTELDLAEPLLKGVQAAGFTECTPIQARTLPHALGGADVAGQAQTGTGKTAAFLLATFQRLLMRAPAQNRKPSQPRALVIAPTRELALQIGKDAEAIGKFSGQIIRVVYGGESYERQRDKLREGVDVLIGTPGRLIDYHKQRVFDLRAADVAVMDEADRM